MREGQTWDNIMIAVSIVNFYNELKAFEEHLPLCWLKFGSHSNAGSYWCTAGHQTLSLIPSLPVLGTRSCCATNEQWCHYNRSINKKWLEMPAKRKTLSFIRYSEAKITLLALYMSVMKPPKPLKFNWTLERFVWTDWLTDRQTDRAIA